MTEHEMTSHDVVVVGSGPGALQVAYDLRALGVDHVVISADDGPGGMFRRFPLFQRLITWTKPFAPAERRTRAYEWYDWNSLLGRDDDERALVADLMDGASYFPSRPEMERGLALFAERGGIQVRYGTRWEATRRDQDGFVVVTSHGELRAKVLVIAVGMTEPWKPDLPGMDLVPHYVDVRSPKEYAGKRVFIVGKRNSGFEVADALLPWARQIILGSPRPARISVLTRTTASARARYLQPYEDHVLGGGNIVLDAAIDRVERTASGYRVHANGTSTPGGLTLDVDEVIAATGFTTPMQDLRDLGVATFHQDRLPAQTPYWESASVPGICFAGSITQGSVGMRKYGIPSNSAAVHGFRYNARVLARHLAEKHFGVAVERPTVDDPVRFLLEEASRAPELWNQMGYLARVVSADPARGLVDEGIVPLAWFVDADGPDAVAVAVETNGEGDIRPAVYLRHDNRVEERLLPTDPMMNFETGEHRTELTAALGYLIR